MQRIYEPENLMEGELLQQMLASEGIEAHLVGRHLLGGTGELPIFGLLGLEVDNDQAVYARELITARQLRAQRPAIAGGRRRTGSDPQHPRGGLDRKSTRLNSSHGAKSRMPSSA